MHFERGTYMSGEVNFILYDSVQQTNTEHSESVKDTVNMNSLKESSTTNDSGEANPMEILNDTTNDTTENAAKKVTKDKPEKNMKKDKLDEENTKKENEKLKDQKIEEYGQATLEENGKNHKIHLLSIIGEIEGHECLSQNTKTTKYEHLLPQLATIEDNNDTDGLLILINTVGGDVSCGLALAEMLASLSKPTVSLVIGDSHSIGVPLAVATDYSFIVPTGTMIVHPVRMSGMVIGAPQTYDYFKLIQDRIVGFVSSHSKIKKERLEQLMLNTGMLTKDLGTILVGQTAVDEGIINEVGGINQAVDKLHEMIAQRKGETTENSSKS